MENLQHKLAIFKSLFKGREDVFATRWEKGGKSGYMPAYFYDPYHYRVHKLNGGSFKDYADKTYLRLTDDQIEKHLTGQQLVGLYPLLPDNSSWFIVADFDEKDWIESCRSLLNICKKHAIPAYLERSQSGNGGHVWIFFDQPYPAVKSRKIVLSLLTQSGIISSFDKSASFDRLFPNQDYLSGKGLGNLIALPFYLNAIQKGNSCFIDPINSTLFEDQWYFLQTIERVPASLLDALFLKISGEPSNNETEQNNSLAITLKNNLQLNRSSIPQLLINFLKDELNFYNTEFIIKKNSGRNTFGTDRYFKFIEESSGKVDIPKGFTGKLLRFCMDHKVEYSFIDKRTKIDPKQFHFSASLREYQQPCIEAANKKDIGIIVAPPGSGKTVVALKIVTDKQQPTLIIVHRKQLADQWAERIEAFLGIPQREIGKISQGKIKMGDKITIATIQSLSKKIDSDMQVLKDAFGLIIVDECHHIPTLTFRDTISKFNSYYLYGLTATPFRKYNDVKIISIYLGDIVAEIKQQDIANNKHPKIIIRDTLLDVPYNAKTDAFEVLSKILIHDSNRNKLILADIIKELASGKKVVILTERKEHIDSLFQYLKQSYETITLSGDDSETNRHYKWAALKAGNYQALITTGQFFGEGTDLHIATCLFLAYPFSFEGKLIQYIGRVQRTEIAPTIYDYRDIKIDYLNRMFLKRNVYYRKLEQQRTLFDLPDDDVSTEHKIAETIIDKEIKVAIESLEFLYGGVRLSHHLSEYKMDVIFDIENWNVRPEFEVLKPYFEKYLKSKIISIHIIVVIKEDTIIAQTATSIEIQKLNREIIESVRFSFVDKVYFGRSTASQNDELLYQLKTSDDTNPIYASGEALLNDVLNKGQYRHQIQLKYLADLHEGEVLKIRFVLSPFSFVFLLAGTTKYHVVMETLDTDEATYIWHIPKNIGELKNALKIIESDLNKIRNDGRQEFLKTSPVNFSRVLHDYSDERKGVIIWRDAIEERLA